MFIPMVQRKFSLETGKEFKVNGHRLKVFHDEDFLERFDLAYLLKSRVYI